jgi:hypothetical protein
MKCCPQATDKNAEETKVIILNHGPVSFVFSHIYQYWSAAGFPIHKTKLIEDFENCSIQLSI